MNRIGRTSALAVAVVGLWGAAALPAAAAQSASDGVGESVGILADPHSVPVMYGGVQRGLVQWQQDPDAASGRKGDSIRVCDTYSGDGRGVEARLIVNGSVDRIATTQGHNAPYCSPWKSGDLTEGKGYIAKTYTMSNNVFTFAGDFHVTA
ncbi:hypothetical protein ACIQNU_27005 [Streptomyces sp. NPDC091292]|uniref:hypothetical protein n=1 Tax=Streptomyces sp. NPDC091292 TaxID=3365991 RepID=UPI0037FF935B